MDVMSWFSINNILSISTLRRVDIHSWIEAVGHHRWSIVYLACKPGKNYQLFIWTY